jgi:nitrile hydratase subunit beta
MNGVHDMGGMHGLGPIAAEGDEPVFHHPWEARAFALYVAARRGGWTLDASRHQIEQIPGADYLRMSYYEKWITGLTALLLKTGALSDGELVSGRPDPGSARTVPAFGAEHVGVIFGKGSRYAREVTTPLRYEVGDAVRARNLNPTGHTRLPRYVRGRVGVITARHGAHVFPDANAHGQGEQPAHLYQVRFEAAELWGGSATTRDAVHLDLWEPYLDPA